MKESNFAGKCLVGKEHKEAYKKLAKDFKIRRVDLLSRAEEENYEGTFIHFWDRTGKENNIFEVSMRNETVNYLLSLLEDTAETKGLKDEKFNSGMFSLKKLFRDPYGLLNQNQLFMLYEYYDFYRRIDEKNFLLLKALFFLNGEERQECMSIIAKLLEEIKIVDNLSDIPMDIFSIFYMCAYDNLDTHKRKYGEDKKSANEYRKLLREEMKTHFNPSFFENNMRIFVLFDRQHWGFIGQLKLIQLSSDIEKRFTIAIENLLLNGATSPEDCDEYRWDLFCEIRALDMEKEHGPFPFQKAT